MSCNKISFSSKQDAKKYANGKKEHNNKPKLNGRFSVYFCYVCEKWHLNSMTRKEIKSIKNKLKSFGIKPGLYQDYKGRTIEVITPPTNFGEINLWLLNFKPVKESE